MKKTKNGAWLRRTRALWIVAALSAAGLAAQAADEAGGSGPRTQTSTNTPVFQALNATINIINASSTVLLTQPTTASSAVAFLNTKKTDTKKTDTTDTKTADAKTDKKSDDSDKPSVVKNESAVKKMYCN